MTATLFLCGDVMTGRGIDQVLPHPGDPTLHEPWVGDAGRYVELAEAAHGTITRPLEPAAVWGNALAELDAVRPAARIVNLETAITRSDNWCRDKEIHYRMHPANVRCLTAARIDVAAIANNHVFDWGEMGLLETLDTLEAAGIKATGAGRDHVAARRPACVPLAGGDRVVVVACASATSGVPQNWGATPTRPGVDLLPDLSSATGRASSPTCALCRSRCGDSSSYGCAETTSSGWPTRSRGSAADSALGRSWAAMTRSRCGGDCRCR